MGIELTNLQLQQEINTCWVLEAQLDSPWNSGEPIPGIPSEVLNSFQFLGEYSSRTEHKVISNFRQVWLLLF